MSEQRLIDANELLEDIESAKENHGMGQIVANTLTRYVKRVPIIDTETMPIVRELREKLERVTAERDAALKWVKELKSEKAAAIGELNGVLASIYRLTEFVDDEVHPVVDYDLYLQLRDMVDEVIRWEHADEWCPDGDHT